MMPTAYYITKIQALKEEMTKSLEGVPNTSIFYPAGMTTQFGVQVGENFKVYVSSAIGGSFSVRSIGGSHPRERKHFHDLSYAQALTRALYLVVSMVYR